MPQVVRRARQKGRAFRLLEFESLRSFKRGEKPSLGSFGRVTYGFRRAFPKYIYVIARMTLRKFQSWAGAPSRGSYYNRLIKKG